MSIDELLAREAIRHTLSVYACAVDRGDVDELAATFTADASYEPLVTRPAVNGHAGIRQFLSGLAEVLTRQQAATGVAFGLRHHLTTSRIDFTGVGQAKGFTRFLALGPQGIDHTGIYADRLVSVEGGGRWLFAHRRIVIDWMAPASPIPALLRNLD